MDEKQFADCVEKYTDAVYRVAFHSCKNPADSEDITQNVFLKLYREPKEFESEEHLRRWLLRVAVNESKKPGVLRMVQAERPAGGICRFPGI